MVLLSCVAACRASTAAAPPPDPAGALGDPADPGSGAPSGALGVLAPDRLLQQLLDEMSRDSRFTAAGDRVWKRLEEDPVLAQRGLALMERVTGSPAFQELIARQVAAGKTPEQVGQDMERRMTGVLDDPVVDKAIEQSLDALIQRPKVDRAAHLWAAVLVSGTDVNRALAEVYLSPPWRRKWEAILGVQPSPELLFQRIDRYLISTEGQWAARIIGEALARDPIAKDPFLRVMESPELTTIAIEVSRSLLEDPAFGDQVNKLLITMMESGTPQSMAAAVRRTLTEVPAVEEAIASSFLMLTAARSLTQRMGVDIRRLILNLRDRADVLEALTPTQQAWSAPRSPGGPHTGAW